MNEEHERITEQRNPASEDLSRLTTRALVGLMNAEDSYVAEAVGEVLDDVAAAVDLAVARLGAGGRLFYLGAGTSGRLGVLDASECPPTFGVPPDLVQAVIAGGPEAVFAARENAEDDEGAAAADLSARGFSAGDVLVGLSASGVTAYVLGAIKYASDLGASTVGVSCNPEAPLRELCQVFIAAVVGPEILAGSTRLKCGTAQKMILNMISTATMVRLERVLGNLMIDVRPTSAKLRQRAVGIIQQLTGVSEGEAERALEASAGNVRKAILALGGEIDKG